MTVGWSNIEHPTYKFITQLVQELENEFAELPAEPMPRGGIAAFTGEEYTKALKKEPSVVMTINARGLSLFHFGIGTFPSVGTLVQTCKHFF